MDWWPLSQTVESHACASQHTRSMFAERMCSL
eukprot:COSAG02_NODE_13685_length_1362_cov_1.358670_4_plen_31_part_01